MKRTVLLLLLLSAFAASCSQEGVSHNDNGTDDYSQIPQDRKDSEKEIITTDGKKYKSVSYHDENGDKQEAYFDSNNKKVDFSEFEPYMPPPSPYGGTLKDRLDKATATEKEQPVDCEVELNDRVPLPEWPEDGDRTLLVDRETGEAVVMINGKKVTDEELERLDKERKQLIEKYRDDRRKKREEVLNKLLKDNPTDPGNIFGLEIDPESKREYLNGDVRYVLVTLKLGKVEEFYKKNKALIRLLEQRPESSSTSL